jgi:hypothetical protein
MTNLTTLDIQRRLLALGYDVGKAGADGKYGNGTIGAIDTALNHLAEFRGAAEVIPPPAAKPASLVPADWMPDAKMLRVICHWTAGQHKASEFDRSHYHVLIEGDGKLIRGIPSIKLNEKAVNGSGYAAHTLGCNSNSIGISLCCMAGAMESPYVPGVAPMTRPQWDALAIAVADLCRRYGIPVTDKTVLSHAEVQNNLAITQRGKWDYTRLAFDPSVKGAKACGDLLRAGVRAHL